MGAPPPAGMSMAGGAPNPTGWRVAAGIGGVILLVPGLVAILTAGMLIEDYVRGRFQDGPTAAFFAGAWLLGALAGLLGGRLLWRTWTGSLTRFDRIVAGILVGLLILQMIFRIMDTLAPLASEALRMIVASALQHNAGPGATKPSPDQVLAALVKSFAIINLIAAPPWYFVRALLKGFSRDLLIRAAVTIGSAVVTLSVLHFYYP